MKDHPRRFLQAVESGMATQPAADGHCAEKPKAIISGQSQAEGMAKFACRGDIPRPHSRAAGTA